MTVRRGLRAAMLLGVAACRCLAVAIVDVWASGESVPAVVGQ
jgi:hypothetical protein